MTGRFISLSWFFCMRVLYDNFPKTFPVSPTAEDSAAWLQKSPLLLCSFATVTWTHTRGLVLINQVCCHSRAFLLVWVPWSFHSLFIKTIMTISHHKICCCLDFSTCNTPRSSQTPWSRSGRRYRRTLSTDSSGSCPDFVRKVCRHTHTSQAHWRNWRKLDQPLLFNSSLWCSVSFWNQASMGWLQFPLNVFCHLVLNKWYNVQQNLKINN